MDKLLRYNGVQEALKFLREDDERTLQEHLEMCQIPAPSYEEGEKAEYVRKKMVDAGLSEVHVDEVGNVLGTWKGTGNGPRIMVAGHTDTVFPRETDLTLKKEGERYSITRMIATRMSGEIRPARRRSFPSAQSCAFVMNFLIIAVSV